MTLQKVCYKAVTGSVIIHVHRFCVCGSCALHCVSSMPAWNEKQHWCEDSTHQWRYYIITCWPSVSMCICACVSVGLMLLSPCANNSPTLPLSIQIMPTVGGCATHQPPSLPWAPMASSKHFTCCCLSLARSFFQTRTHTHALALNEQCRTLLRATKPKQLWTSGQVKFEWATP